MSLAPGTYVIKNYGLYPRRIIPNEGPPKPDTPIETPWRTYSTRRCNNCLDDQSRNCINAWIDISVDEDGLCVFKSFARPDLFISHSHGYNGVQTAMWSLGNAEKWQVERHGEATDGRDLYRLKAYPVDAEPVFACVNGNVTAVKAEPDVDCGDCECCSQITDASKRCDESCRCCAIPSDTSNLQTTVQALDELTSDECGWIGCRRPTLVPESKFLNPDTARWVFVPVKPTKA